jgi:hypothetical protein
MAIVGRMLVAAAILGSVALAADLPVVAAHLTTGPASHVQLTNTGSQTVNAWSLAVTTPAGSGRSHQVVETVDAYLSEAVRGVAGIPDRLNPLPPGQTREISLDPLPVDATVRVLAVVLEDDTAVGDAGAIRAIFDRRASERDELHRVIETFADVLASGRGIAALQELKRRFDVSVQEESTPHRAAREAVESYLRRTTAENADQIEQLLRQYIALVERQHELAVRHSRWMTSPRSGPTPLQF